MPSTRRGVFQKNPEENESAVTPLPIRKKTNRNTEGKGRGTSFLKPTHPPLPSDLRNLRRSSPCPRQFNCKVKKSLVQRYGTDSQDGTSFFSFFFFLSMACKASKGYSAGRH
ncbi:hypothetical protein K445DRAFT_176553 [Daldinia sp. EC12]|nr:hypothetical protein K445DRAFT_176553 [Daldinia sp. EC12]